MFGDTSESVDEVISPRFLLSHTTNNRTNRHKSRPYVIYIVTLMTNNKSHFLLIVLLMVFVPFALTSCGDDEPSANNNHDNNSSCGKVKVHYEGAINESLYAYNATCSAGHQEVHGTVLDNLANGATFKVDLSEDSPADVISIDGYIYCDATATWQFDTDDDIRQGATITIQSSHWGDNSFDNAGYFSENCRGAVRVKSVKNNKITLEFKDFKFDRISEFRVGNSTFQDLTINGEITFDIE